MDRRLIWAWGTFVALGAGTLFLTNSITMALAVGVSSAACVWLATTQVTRQWQYRVEAFSAAAHGLLIKSAGSLEDQLDFTREVELTALANRENARRLKLLRAALRGSPARPGGAAAGRAGLVRDLHARPLS